MCLTIRATLQSMCSSSLQTKLTVGIQGPCSCVWASRPFEVVDVYGQAWLDTNQVNQIKAFGACQKRRTTRVVLSTEFPTYSYNFTAFISDTRNEIAIDLRKTDGLYCTEQQELSNKMDKFLTNNSQILRPNFFKKRKIASKMNLLIIHCTFHLNTTEHKCTYCGCYW